MDDHKLITISIFLIMQSSWKICQKITNFLGNDFLENNFGLFYLFYCVGPSPMHLDLGQTQSGPWTVETLSTIHFAEH
jgi:hypothetical protein